MRVLFHGINFSPELTGIGKYSGEMVEWLDENGVQVDVITSVPYYPQWKLNAGFKNTWQRRKIQNGTILRGPVYIPFKVTSIKRILHECSFTLSTLIYWIPFLFRKYDFVIVVCPVLQSGIIPSFFKYLKKFKLIVHVQDLQVDAAKQLGMVKSGVLIRILERVERFIFNRADYVSTISEGMRNKILNKGIGPEKTFLLRNWVDVDSIFPLQKSDIERIKKHWGYDSDDYIVLYSGNMGEKQGLEIIIEAASQLKENDNIKFLMVGEGASKTRLIELAKKAELKNIRFESLVSYDKLNELLNLASVHLVLQKSGATDLVMPSKLGGIFAVGGMSIVATDFESDLYRLVNNNNLGKCITPEDVNILTDSIVESIESNIKNYKITARNFAESELSKQVVLQQFKEKLINLSNE